jgi:hypothetical protein
VVEEKDARLSNGMLVHSPAYVEQARRHIDRYCVRYLRALRTVSEAEIEMDFLGMPYARSSDDWREDAELVRAA